MAVDIKLKRSHTHSNIPTTSDLSEGEFAVNTYDGKMFMRDGSSNIVTVANHYATDYESSTKTFYVTVATSTAAHVHHGSGSSNKYKINGVFSPFLKLIPGITYRFDQSDSSNSGHPFRFYLDENKGTAYTTGVTTSGTAGSSGAYTEIVATHSTPSVLHYQCSAHGLMGWAAFVQADNLTAFDTGDLTEGSNLYYTDARAQAVSINNVVEDTTPQLGGDLDMNGNDINGASGAKISLHSDSNNPAINIDGVGPNWIRFEDNGGGNTNAVNIIYRTTPNDLRIEKATNSNIMAEFGGDDGHVKLYHDNSGKLETTSSGIDITGNLTLTSTDAGSSAAPTIDLVRDSSSPADADYLGQIAFKGDDDGGSSHTYAKISGKIGDASAGTEDGLIEFAVVSNGSNEIIARIKQDGLFLNTGNTLRFEGSSSNANETTLTVINPTADRTISLPDSSGTLALTSDIGSTDVSADSTPQLGGDLDVNGNAIVSASNGNIAITPNGSGKVIIDGLSHPVADGNAGQVLKTDGSGNLAFASVGSLAGAGISNVSDDTSPQLGGNLDVVTHSIVSTSNRDINLTPNGSGKVVVSSTGIEFSDGSVQTAAGADQGFAIAMGIALG